MGCCSNGSMSKDCNILERELKRSIERNNPEKLYLLQNLYPNLVINEIIDEPFTNYLGFTVNPLGYALLKNKIKAFEKLVEIGAKINSLEEIFQMQAKSIIEVICYYGLGDFFKYFLPLLDDMYRQASFIQDLTLTIDFDSSVLFGNKINKLNSFPIHLAVDQGHLHLINIAYEYSLNFTRLPGILDLHYIFEKTGENCALVACRKGHFAIVKYLWEVIHSDFSVKNKNNENALVVTAAGSRKNPEGGYFHIFIYLIEQVKVPYLDCFEELLLLLDQEEMLIYFVALLKKSGITAKKSDLEEKFNPKPVEQHRDSIPELKGPFELNKFLADKDQESAISEIRSDQKSNSFNTCNFGSFLVGPDK